jgi:hypothetical protein
MLDVADDTEQQGISLIFAYQLHYPMGRGRSGLEFGGFIWVTSFPEHEQRNNPRRLERSKGAGNRVLPLRQYSTSRLAECSIGLLLFVEALRCRGAV